MAGNVAPLADKKFMCGQKCLWTN